MNNSVMCALGLYTKITRHLDIKHARIQKILPEGVQLWQCFCFVDEGREEERIKNPRRDIIGPPAKRHFNSVLLAGQWWPNSCWLSSFAIFQGIATCNTKKLYILWFFVGRVGVGTPSPPLDPRMSNYSHFPKPPSLFMNKRCEAG